MNENQNTIEVDSCRVCLIYKGTIALTDKRYNRSINDLIMEFSDLNLTIYGDCNLPTRVCSRCVRYLENAVKLKTNIQDSDIRLRKILNNVLSTMPVKTYVASANDEENDIGDDFPLICKEEPLDFGFLNLDQVIKDDLEVSKNCLPNEDENIKRKKIIKKKVSRSNRKKEQNTICSECGERFKSEKKLQIHSIVHMGPRPYKCKLCPKDFAHRSNLDDHRKSHTGEKKYICEYCSKAFIKKSCLTRHITVHLPDSEKKIECKDCGLKFHHKKNLNSHRIIHSNIKPFICSECGRGFYKKVNLENHVDGVHRRIKRYTCSYCNKLYSSSNSLVRHIRIHTGEKPYECQYCDSRFNQSTLRVKHHRSHVQRGDKPKNLVENNSEEQIKLE